MCKDETSPIASELIEYTKQQEEIIQKLKDKITELKDKKVSPEIKPSNLEKNQLKKNKNQKTRIRKKISNVIF